MTIITKQGNEIIASPLSQLVIKYLNSSNNRERDKLFLLIADHYKLKINKITSKMSKDDKKDFIQIYHLQLLKAIKNWSKNNSNFETYFYPYVIACLRLYLKDKNMFKEGIQVTYIDTYILENIINSEEYDYDLIQDMKIIHKNKDK